MLRTVWAHLREIGNVLLAGIVGLLGLFLGIYIASQQYDLFKAMFPDRHAREHRLDRRQHVEERAVDRLLGQAMVERAASGQPFTLDEILPAPAMRACIETQRWPDPPNNPARDLAQRSGRKAYWLSTPHPSGSTLVMEHADGRVMAHMVRYERGGWPFSGGVSTVRFQFTGYHRHDCGAPHDIVLLPRVIDRTLLLAVRPMAPVIDARNARGAVAVSDDSIEIALTRKWLDQADRFHLRDIVPEPFESACLQTWQWGPPDEAAKRWVMSNDMPWMWDYEGNPALAVRRADGSARIYRVGTARPGGERAQRLTFYHGGGNMWGQTCSKTGDLVFVRRPTIRGRSYEFAVRSE